MAHINGPLRAVINTSRHTFLYKCYFILIGEAGETPPPPPPPPPRVLPTDADTTAQLSASHFQQNHQILSLSASRSSAFAAESIAPLSLMNIVSHHLQFFISIRPANAKHGGWFHAYFFGREIKARNRMLADPCRYPAHQE